MVGLTVIALGVVLVHPGLLVVWAVRQAFELPLDAGQMWSFGSVASFAAYACLALRRRSWVAAVGPYLALSFGSVAFAAVTRWGPHAEWPTRLWSLVVPK